MNELKNIASLVEEELNKFRIDHEVDVRFSNFSEDTDIQINSLLKIKKDKNFNKIVSSIKEKFEKKYQIKTLE